MSIRMILSLSLVLLMSPESLDASAEKAEFVIGVNVNRLLHEVFGKEISISRHGTGRRGVLYYLTKDDKPIGSITIGVFSNHTSASNIFEEHLEITSGGPNRNLSTELGDKALGWWRERQQCFRRILFARNNVVISVYIDHGSDLSVPAGISSDIAMTSTKAIDRALIEGIYGVSKGPVMPLPRILKMEAVGKLVPGADVDIRMSIAVPEDLNGDIVGFVDQRGAKVSGMPIIVRQREVEIIRILRYRVPRTIAELGKFSFDACYATPGCVLVSREFTLDDIVEKAESKQNLPASEPEMSLAQREARSFWTWPSFLIGGVTGIGVVYLLLRLTKKSSSCRE